ncbi:hypothetical protein ACLOJK_009529, partial [Asimina triloba]
GSVGGDGVRIIEGTDGSMFECACACKIDCCCCEYESCYWRVLIASTRARNSALMTGLSVFGSCWAVEEGAVEEEGGVQSPPVEEGW